eukprot:gene38747-47851_t
MGVAALPEFAHLQVGDFLKQHVIQYASTAVPEVTEIVAMTRCLKPTASVEEYLEKVKSEDDPILQFHLKAGAKVIQAVANYRVADTVNWGHTVLISYGDLHKKLTILAPQPEVDKPAVRRQSSNETFGNHTVTSLAELKSVTVQQLSDLIASITHKTVSLNVPFMSLGLDSLGMVELISRLQRVIDANFDEMRGELKVPSPSTTTSDGGSPDSALAVENTVNNYCSYKISTTILFNYPTPNLMLKFLNRSISNRHADFSREIIGISTPPGTPSREVLSSGGGGEGGKKMLKRATSGISAPPVSRVESVSKVSKGPDFDSVSESVEKNKDNLFAIVGMSCRFPTGGHNTHSPRHAQRTDSPPEPAQSASDIHSPEGFYNSLCRGLDSVTTVPIDWTSTTRYASFLSGEVAECFDYSQYNLTHAETVAMDPHQRLLLELAHEALCESDVKTDRCGDSNLFSHSTDSADGGQGEEDDQDYESPVVGVFIGLSNNEWSQQVASSEITPYTSTGTALSATANRISYLL